MHSFPNLSSLWVIIYKTFSVLEFLTLKSSINIICIIFLFNEYVMLKRKTCSRVRIKYLTTSKASSHVKIVPGPGRIVCVSCLHRTPRYSDRQTLLRIRQLPTSNPDLEAGYHDRFSVVLIGFSKKMLRKYLKLQSHRLLSDPSFVSTLSFDAVYNLSYREHS